MVNGFDARLSRAARGLLGGNGAARRAAVLGRPWVAVVEGFAAALALRASGRPAGRVAMAAPAAALLGAALKRARPRPRPLPVRLRRKGRQSMPSTHVASLAAVLACLWRAAPPTRPWRAVLWAGTALCLGIAVERVSAGAHWPSDVLAGAALGAATGLALAPGPGIPA